MMQGSEKTKDQLIEEIQKLRDSEQLLRTTFEQSPACMGRADFDGVLKDVNQTFCTWLGYGRDDLVGKKTHDITHPDDLGITATQLDDMGTPGSRFIMEKRYVRRDGRLHSLASSGSRGLHR